MFLKLASEEEEATQMRLPRYTAEACRMSKNSITERRPVQLMT
jgi:hypothetical protein